MEGERQSVSSEASGIVGEGSGAVLVMFECSIRFYECIVDAGMREAHQILRSSPGWADEVVESALRSSLRRHNKVKPIPELEREFGLPRKLPPKL